MLFSARQFMYMLFLYFWVQIWVKGVGNSARQTLGGGVTGTSTDCNVAVFNMIPKKLIQHGILKLKSKDIKNCYFR